MKKTKKTAKSSGAGSREARRWRAFDKALTTHGDLGVLVLSILGIDTGSDDPPKEPDVHHALCQIVQEAAYRLCKRALRGSKVEAGFLGFGAQCEVIYVAALGGPLPD